MFTCYETEQLPVHKQQATRMSSGQEGHHELWGKRGSL